MFGPGFGFEKTGPGMFAMRFGPGRWSFDGGDFGDFAGSRGRRGGRRRMFESGQLRLVLLKLIQDQPRHGYDLIRAIEELTHGSYAPSPGIVYPTLTLLQDMGFIQEAAADGPRKAFAVTPEGVAHLADNEEEVEALFERLTGAGEGKRRAGGRPIQRAVGNLLSAVWHRVTADDMSEERLHEMAAVLDEAAQKIERLK
ncbi:MAG TPA: PadR family transcriptional regulator [Allosphingosinicella sp.]|nr:PadR family transcriptional regulator [Allosphingosinicella sp.]